MKSLDTECTGLDLRFGAKPFFITICTSADEVLFWEFDVDPETREPQVSESDLDEIACELNPYNNENEEDGDGWGWRVCQNTKFDVKALSRLRKEFAEDWDWTKTHETLISGHLLASNQPHDLTTMALVSLGVNIAPYEKALEKATKEARRIAASRYPTWRIAKKGLPEMPSAKETVWKYDSWLPRAIVKKVIQSLEFGILPTHPQQPTVGRVSECDVRIDRGTKWGNPFVIGKHGDRVEVVQKYADYIWKNSDLIASLPELYSKVIGCHCCPELCHGDVLRALCHPWMTVLRDYANTDSSVTLPLHKAHMKEIEGRGLAKIYYERLKILPIVYAMEDRGITLNRDRLERIYKQYSDESEACHARCLEASDWEIDKLPVQGTSNTLKYVLLEKFKLESNKTTKKGNDSLDKSVLEYWSVTLPEESKPHTFVTNLRDYRRRRTAMTYMEGYKKFWFPWVPVGNVDPVTGAGWYVLHPSLNPTGTYTLRWSSSNPNEQNISKQEGFNLRAMYGPAPGREWWSCDAQNIELRIPAYEAGELEMIDIFERPDDPPYFGSYHLLVFDTLHPEKFAQHGKKCKEIYDSTWYQWTKNGNFAVGYGSVESSGTADRAYHVPGAFARIKGRFGKIHGPSGLNDRMIKHAELFGYVETMPDKTVDPMRGYPLLCTRTNHGRILPTVPLNYHVQGTAMWWMMKAMIRCQEYLDQVNAEESGGYYLIIQVHDELVFDFQAPPTSWRQEPWKYNLRHVRQCMRLMRQGGDDIGVPTPVSCKYHNATWAKGLSV